MNALPAGVCGPWTGLFEASLEVEPEAALLWRQHGLAHVLSSPTVFSTIGMS